MKYSAVLLIPCVPMLGQTAVERMLAQLASVQWRADYSSRASCQSWTPFQLAVQATDQWSFHCADRGNGIIRESFFYAFDDAAQPIRLRVDLRPEDESQPLNAEIERELTDRLRRLYGSPENGPELMEIGFRKLRFGQPVAGEHWHSKGRHYFLHHNQSNQMPMGMRRGTELIVMDDRLFEERAKDDFIHRVDGLGSPVQEKDNPYAIPPWKTQAEREAIAGQTWRRVLDLLTRAERASREEKSKLLLDADPLIVQLSVLLSGPAELNLDPTAAAIRRPTMAASLTRTICCGASGGNSPIRRWAKSLSCGCSNAAGPPVRNRVALRIPTCFTKSSTGAKRFWPRIQQRGFGRKSYSRSLLRMRVGGRLRERPTATQLSARLHIRGSS